MEQGRLVRGEGDEVRVLNAGLAGLDTLWALALDNSNKDVARDAVKATIEVHVHVEPDASVLGLAADAAEGSVPFRRASIDYRRALWAKFVARCTDLISTNAAPLIAAAKAGRGDGAGDRARTRTIAKVLRVLTRFLTAVEEAVAATAAGGDSVVERDHVTVVLPEGPAHVGEFGLEVEVPVFVRQLEQGRPTLQQLHVVVRPALETLGMLRDRIADAYDVLPSFVRLEDIGQRYLLGADRDGGTIVQQRLETGIRCHILTEAASEAAGHVGMEQADRIREQLRRRLVLEGVPAAEIEAAVADDAALTAAERSLGTAPRKLLSDNEAYFDLLFALLSVHNPAIVADSWNLLQTLPVNAHVEADIHTLRGAVASPFAAGGGAASAAAAAHDGAAREWSAVFDGAAPLKLLYSLQITAHLLDKLRAQEATALGITLPEPDAEGGEGGGASESKGTDAGKGAGKPPAPGDASSLEMRTEWARAFVRTGALAHLHNLVMTVDLGQLLAPGVAPLVKQCACLLVQTYTRFVAAFGPALRKFTAAPGEGAAVVFQVDRPALVNRLVTLLSFATTTGITRGRAGGAAAAGGATAAADDMPPAPTTLSKTVSAQSTGSGGPRLGRTRSSQSSGGGVGPQRRGALSRSNSNTSASGGVGGTTNTRNPANWYSADLDDDGFGLASFFNTPEDAALLGLGGGGGAAGGAGGGGDGDARAGTGPETAIVDDVLRLLAAALVGPDVVTPLSGGVGSGEVAAKAIVHPAAVALAPHAAAISALTSFVSVDRVLLLALVAPRDKAVRSAVASGLQQLVAVAGTNSSLAQFLVSHFLAHVDAPYAYPDTCAEFYGLLAGLITPSVTLPGDTRALVTRLSTLIRTHPIVEVGSGEKDVRDTVLAGLLRVLRAVLAGRNDVKEHAGASTGCDLVEEVFERCLFAMPTAETDAAAASSGITSVLGGRLPKCKARETRAAALDLLLEVAVGCMPNALRLCEKFLPHHDADAAAAHAAAAAKSAGVGGRDEKAAAAASLDEDEFKPPGTGKYGSISGPNQVIGPQAPGAGEGAGAGAGGSGAPANMSGRSRNLVDPRSSTGYVGLRNLGCICYMNSTIQQFFMNPDFRRGVLSWNETAATAAERADSMMYQMQKQFAYLQESEKQYYNPRGLCNAIKDWEGNPTDVTEQKDVPEFLTKLFADMETQCQGTPLANLPKDVFGGQTQQELIAEDPRGGTRKKLYATRDDDYYFLQVGVKGKKNLQQALSDLVSGEMVDYKWTLPADAPAAGEAAPGGGGVGGGGGGGSAAPAAAAKKPEETTVRTMKRMSIKSVGDHLMLHLNRFEFDYETMQQAKLNDRFEFPRNLDMWPYTVWGRADAFAERDTAGGAPDKSLFQYELVGVVIHMGTAIGGHYYSYIRERDESGPGERWFEFNDSFVSPWAGTDDAFVRDCFGGVESVTTGGYSHTTYVNGVPRVYTSPAYVHERIKSANAFVVYYDRVKPRPTAAVLAREMSVTTADAPEAGTDGTPAPPASLVATTALARHPRDAFVARLKERYGGGAGGVRKTVRAPVPTDLLRVIQDENTEFWRLSVIYQVDYFTHLLGLMGAVAAMAAEAPAVAYPWQGLRNLGDAMAAGGPLMVAVRLAVAFMLNTLTDSNQKATIPQWQGHLSTLLSRNTVAAAWIVSWLTTDTLEFRRMFLADSSAAGDSMRPLLAAILASALGTLWPIEAAGRPAGAPALLPPLAEGAAGGRPLTGVPGALARNFVEGLLDQLPRLHTHWRRFGSYFTLLRNFADISVDTRRFLLERGVVARLIDFALGGDSPHPELNDTGLQAALKLGTEPTRDASGRYMPTETRIMGDNYGGPDLTELMATVTSLVRGVGLLARLRPPSPHSPLPALAATRSCAHARRPQAPRPHLAPSHPSCPCWRWTWIASRAGSSGRRWRRR